MKKEHLTTSPAQTKKLGEKFAKGILKNKPKKIAFVIGLIGGLGAGKTTFLQGFVKGLGVKETILSPTFVIMKRFRINHRFFKTFYHIDCYRINPPKELLDLGFKEIIANPKNIVAIEWADRVRKILPQNTTILKFEFANEKTRKIMLK